MSDNNDPRFVGPPATPLPAGTTMGNPIAMASGGSYYEIRTSPEPRPLLAVSLSDLAEIAQVLEGRDIPATIRGLLGLLDAAETGDNL